MDTARAKVELGQLVKKPDEIYVIYFLFSFNDSRQK